MTDRKKRLEDLFSRQEIHDVLMRYARGVDRADRELLASCYHPDAIEEHGSTWSGPAHEYIDGAMERLRAMGTMNHYICNVHVSLEGDVAYVEAYLLTFARFSKNGQSFDTLTGGRICDRFERRDGGWKIAHRKMAFDWNHDMPSQEGWCLGLFDPADPRMIMGEKGPGDLSYKRF